MDPGDSQALPAPKQRSLQLCSVHAEARFNLMKDLIEKLAPGCKRERFVSPFASECKELSPFLDTKNNGSLLLTNLTIKSNFFGLDCTKYHFIFIRTANKNTAFMIFVGCSCMFIALNR